ncbi:MAG: carbonic anhydrase family protein [Oligoflexales bacterium]|nr:carbonic anhydrase family protein [Oligoflexales bacterium]
MVRLNPSIVWPLAFSLALGVFGGIFGLSYYLNKKQNDEAEKLISKEVEELASHQKEHEIEEQPSSNELPAEEVTENATHDQQAAVEHKADHPPTIEHLSEEWSFSGEERGPGSWATLNDSYKLCGTGQHQSPIDLEKFERKNLPRLNLFYKIETADLYHNGNTVVLEMNDEKSGTLDAGGKVFYLKKIMFRTPSEHKDDSITYGMEIQLFHEDESGRIAILSLFVDQGNRNRSLDLVWEQLPKNAAYPKRKLRFDPSSLLPEKMNYFYYEGSLSYPPCTEGVDWFILSEPVFASVQQLSEIEKLSNGNIRPIQKRRAHKLYFQK